MTASEPISPPAPPRFSITTGCFRISLTLGATWRITMSVEAPGAKGTMILIGCSGHSAREPVATTRRDAASHWEIVIAVTSGGVVIECSHETHHRPQRLREHDRIP